MRRKTNGGDALQGERQVRAKAAMSMRVALKDPARWPHGLK